MTKSLALAALLSFSFYSFGSNISNIARCLHDKGPWHQDRQTQNGLSVPLIIDVIYDSRDILGLAFLKLKNPHKDWSAFDNIMQNMAPFKCFDMSSDVACHIAADQASKAVLVENLASLLKALVVYHSDDAIKQSSVSDLNIPACVKLWLRKDEFTKLFFEAFDVAFCPKFRRLHETKEDPLKHACIAHANNRFGLSKDDMVFAIKLSGKFALPTCDDIVGKPLPVYFNGSLAFELATEDCLKLAEAFQATCDPRTLTLGECSVLQYLSNNKPYSSQGLWSVRQRHRLNDLGEHEISFTASILGGASKTSVKGRPRSSSAPRPSSRSGSPVAKLSRG